MSGHIRAQLVIVVVLASSLAGCNILNTKSEHPLEPVSSTFEFRVAGGFAGSVEQTVVDSAGLARLTSTSTPASPPQTYTYELTPNELHSLRDEFESADFFSLDSSYEALHKIMDGFDLEVKWSMSTRSKRIWVEANATTPPRLTALIGFMTELTNRIRSTGQKS